MSWLPPIIARASRARRRKPVNGFSSGDVVVRASHALQIFPVGSRSYLDWRASEELDHSEVHEQQDRQREDRERSGGAPDQEDQEREGDAGDAQPDLVGTHPGPDGSRLPARLVGSADAPDEPTRAPTGADREP